MGKITGFLELDRVAEVAEAARDRVRHYREFILTLEDDAASKQGARCMDCGIPFCQSGCPVNNIIPDWNDLVYRRQWKQALDTLHSTNNFPEFTGRVCPAPCEAACTLNINNDPVGIKSIEHFIIDKGWEEGWVVPRPPSAKSGRSVAVVGSGPAGLACAQQLARAGHDVVVFEKSDRIGGLMRYGIPDFKMEKPAIDRRMAQMSAEGVRFRPGVEVGRDVDPQAMLEEFDAVVLSGGAEKPRDLPVPGQLVATGKRVVVIGGGDTGSDCVGTSNRQGAASVTQFELLPQPPEVENKPLVWPYWPVKLRTSSSHEEGCSRDWSVATKRFEGSDGRVARLIGARLEWTRGADGQMKMTEVPDSEFAIEADLVLLAMGFTGPASDAMLARFGVARDGRSNVAANTDDYRTSVDHVFAAGDIRRGQTLVVWAIREGRQCARAVDEFLMGHSALPR